MKKEILTCENVKRDLLKLLACKAEFKSDWRILVFAPAYIIAVLLPIYFNVGFTESFPPAASIISSLFFLGIALYQTVIYVREMREIKALRRDMEGRLDKGEFHVSVERLNHIAEYTAYYPRGHSLRDKREIRDEITFYFKGSASWHVPDVIYHYEWSAELRLSTKGLCNVSIPEDEFFFISLVEYPELSYIYPVKFFGLGDDLKLKEE